MYKSPAVANIADRTADTVWPCISFSGGGSWDLYFGRTGARDCTVGYVAICSGLATISNAKIWGGSVGPTPASGK